MERAVWLGAAILFGLVFLLILVTEFTAIVGGDGIAIGWAVLTALGLVACLRARKHSFPVR